MAREKLIERAAAKAAATSAAPEARRVKGGALLRLIAAMAACVALTLLLRWGLSQGFAALFRAWNVSGKTVSGAPGWARLVYSWHGTAITLIVNGAVIVLSLALSRRWRREGFLRGIASPNSAPDTQHRMRNPVPEVGRGTQLTQTNGDTVRTLRMAAIALLAGLCVALASAGLFLLTDSLRLLWPLSRPQLSAGLAPLAAMSLMTVLAEELFTKRLVYALADQAWGPAVATAVATAAFFLSNGGYAGNILCAINVALMGVLCCAVYARDGLASSIALRWGWSFANVFLLGYGGGRHAVYRLYGVSENLFTGGDAGLVYGLWLTIVLCAGLSLLCGKGARGWIAARTVRK